ncbi:MAG: hypothetical protein ACFN4U_02935 [Candidatus Absconditicoccaceae bacterium]
MKNKLKYFFVLVLVLFFIPSTYAFELKNFNGDPEEVEVVSSKEYNGITYYYKRISGGDFFQCIEKTDVINETNSGDYVSSPATPAMTCPAGKVLKYKRWRNNFNWGYRQNGNQYLNWELDFGYYGYDRLEPQFYLVRNGFGGKFFMIQGLKNDKGQSAFMYRQADYRGDWKLTTSIGSSQYAVGLPNVFGVHMFKSGQEEVEGSTFFQGKFRLHKMILTNYYTLSNINYETVPVVLIDTHKHLVYEYASDIKDLLKDNLQYMDLRLLDNCPAKIREYHFGAGTASISFNGALFSKKEGYSILNTNWRDLTEKECATYKKDIKDRMIYNMDYLNFMRGATEGDKDKNQVGQQYNQCLNYYVDMYNLARFSDKCSGEGKDEQAMKNFLDIKDWDGDGAIPQLTGQSAWICGVYAKNKQKFKQKYADKRSDFEKEWDEYMFSPDALVPADKCRYIELNNKNNGEKFSVLSSSGFSEFLNAFKGTWNNRGKTINVGSGQYISQNVFERDLGLYTAYAVACRDKNYMPTPYDSVGDYLKNNLLLGLFQSDNNVNVCKYAEELKRKFDKQYGNLSFQKEYRDSVKGELGGNLFNSKGGLDLSGNKATIDNLPESIFKESEQSIGSQLLNKVKLPFYSGYNSVLGLSCEKRFPHIEIMDYVAMSFFALLVFIFLKFI